MSRPQPHMLSSSQVPSQKDPSRLKMNMPFPQRTPPSYVPKYVPKEYLKGPQSRLFLLNTLVSIGREEGYSMGLSRVMIFRTFGCGQGRATLMRGCMLRLAFNECQERLLREVPKLAEPVTAFGWLAMDTWLPLSEEFPPLRDSEPTWLPLSMRDQDRMEFLSVVGLPQWLSSSLSLSKKLMVNCLKWSFSSSKRAWNGCVDLYAVLLVLAMAILERRLMMAALTLNTLVFFLTRSSTCCFSGESLPKMRVKKDSCWFFSYTYSLRRALMAISSSSNMVISFSNAYTQIFLQFSQTSRKTSVMMSKSEFSSRVCQ